MASAHGTIVLMGSGELTATMVEVHKEMLAGLGAEARAVFLDTPAGFQLNVDHLSAKASEYFKTRVLHPLEIVSFKSKDHCTGFESEKAFRALREADFVLIGPGSPTYAVCQWLETVIPDILKKSLEEGGCLVAASAAALTVGRLTLPVYEIYKVGEKAHWVEGMNILEPFGFDLVVIPHWNNAEGGTHDTRFCYMGESRFKALESLLPEDVSVLGLDEHTACIIDLGRQVFSIRGIGSVTLRKQGRQRTFRKGDCLPLDVLRGSHMDGEGRYGTQVVESFVQKKQAPEDSFWNRVHSLRALFQEGLEEHVPEKTVSALLDLDGEVWRAHQALENQECISQAREVLRDMMALIGPKLASCPPSARACLGPLADSLVALRERFRREKKWLEADAIRDSLAQADIVVEDLKDGARWDIHHTKEES